MYKRVIFALSLPTTSAQATSTVTKGMLTIGQEGTREETRKTSSSRLC